jgi:hypothetical protein
MNIFEQSYNILKILKDRFAGIRSVTLFLIDNTLIIRWEWTNDKSPTAVQGIDITQDDWKTDEFEKVLLERIEASYCMWEVGEE